MSKGKVLVIGSNATRIEIQGGGTGPTGQYLNETVVPMLALIDAGYEVLLATPNGSKPYIDPASDSAQHFGGDEATYRRAKAFFAVPAGFPRTDPSWLVLGQQHRPRRGHGAGGPGQDPPHRQNHRVRPAQRAYGAAARRRDRRPGRDEVLIIRKE